MREIKDNVAGNRIVRMKLAIGVDGAQIRREGEKRNALKMLQLNKLGLVVSK